MFNYIAKDNSIDVFCKRFRKSSDLSEITNAVMTFTILDAATGLAVSGASAVSMPYIGNSLTDPGHYRGTVTGLSLTLGSLYQIVVTSSNYPVTWTQQFRCQTRPFLRQ